MGERREGKVTSYKAQKKNEIHEIVYEKRQQYLNIKKVFIIEAMHKAGVFIFFGSKNNFSDRIKTAISWHKQESRTWLEPQTRPHGFAASRTSAGVFNAVTA